MTEHIVDGMKVVRCKHCKYYHEMEEGFFDCICSFGLDFPQENDFCSYGEKKDGTSDGI